MVKISGGKLWRLSPFAAFLIAFAGEVLVSRVHAANDAPPVPQLIYMTRAGLDLRHNRIDQLINTFGFICLHNPTNSRPCSIEKELVSFLKTLSPDPNEIARELTKLGAACQTNNERLTCLYERHVEVGAWQVGSSEPETVFDEYFRVALGVAKDSDSSRYHAVFNRTETVTRRRAYGKAN